MSTYTQEQPNIFILNDKNIVHGLNGDTPLGHNPIPSLSLHVESYKTLSGMADGISAVVDSLSAGLSGKIDQLELSANGISGYVDKLELSASGISGIVNSLSAGLSGKIDALELSVKGVSAVVDALSAGLSGKIDAVQLSVAGLSNYTKDLALSATGLSDSISALALSVNGVSGVVDANKAASEQRDAYLSGVISNIISADLYALSGEVSAVSSALDLKIETLSTDLSDTVNKQFVHISGDTIGGSLSVAGTTTISSDLIAKKSLYVGTNVTTTEDVNTIVLGDRTSPAGRDSFVWNGNNGAVYDVTTHGTHGTFNINPEGGLNGLYIGQETLSTTFSKYQLTATMPTDLSDFTNGAGYALSADVPTKVSQVENDAAFLSAEDFDLSSDTTNHKIILVAGDKTYSIDTTDFIKSRMIYKAQITTNLSGEKVLRLWFSASETDFIDIVLTDLVKIYTAGYGISVDNEYRIHVTDVIAKKVDLDAVSGAVDTINNSTVPYLSGVISGTLSDITDLRLYADSLSNTTVIDPGEKYPTYKGTIPTLSSAIAKLRDEIGSGMALAGHIQLARNTSSPYVPTYNDDTLSGIFRYFNLAEQGKLRSGNVYEVSITGLDYASTTDLQNSFFMTKDATPIKLAHRDHIIIHSHDGGDIRLEDVANYMEVIPAVRYFEYYRLSGATDALCAAVDYLSGTLSNKVMISTDCTLEALSAEGYPYNTGDILIIKSTILPSIGTNPAKYQHTAYVYDDEVDDFKQMDDNYALDHVYVNNEFTYSGPWTKIGNIDKQSTDIISVATTQCSLTDMFKQIFSKKEAPTKTKTPAETLTVKNGTETLNSYYEAGTTITPALTANISRGCFTPWHVLSSGLDTYRQNPTGLSDFTLQITDTYGQSVTSSYTSADTRTGAQLTGETNNYNMLSTLTPVKLVIDKNYVATAKVTYNTSNFALDNEGETTTLKFDGTTLTKTSGTVIPYYKVFYGTKTSKAQDMSTCDSAYIRGTGMASTTSTAGNGTKVTISLPVGTLRVVIAYPSRFTSNLASVTDKNGTGANVRSAFNASPILRTVKDAGNSDVEYKVFYTDFASPTDKANEYTATI